MTCRKSSDLKPKECCAHAVAALDQHLTDPIQGSHPNRPVLDLGRGGRDEPVDPLDHRAFRAGTL